MRFSRLRWLCRLGLSGGLKGFSDRWRLRPGDTRANRRFHLFDSLLKIVSDLSRHIGSGGYADILNQSLIRYVEISGLP